MMRFFLVLAAAAAFFLGAHGGYHTMLIPHNPGHYAVGGADCGC